MMDAHDGCPLRMKIEEKEEEEESTLLYRTSTQSSYHRPHTPRRITDMLCTLLHAPTALSLGLWSMHQGQKREMINPSHHHSAQKRSEGN